MDWRKYLCFCFLITISWCVHSIVVVCINSNSHTRLSYTTKIKWSYTTLHLELETMNGEGVWASIYRWIEVDPWIHVLSISSLGLNRPRSGGVGAPLFLFFYVGEMHQGGWGGWGGGGLVDLGSQPTPSLIGGPFLLGGKLVGVILSGYVPCGATF